MFFSQVHVPFASGIRKHIGDSELAELFVGIRGVLREVLLNLRAGSDEEVALRI